jgi:hypothetical protein
VQINSKDTANTLSPSLIEALELNNNISLFMKKIMHKDEYDLAKNNVDALAALLLSISLAKLKKKQTPKINITYLTTASISHLTLTA